eukprot:CAMPEP_0201477290 /NCGR_PEP_ID=MMETSP0151_2-20130828/2344_1 /ASSEMBLY_ACC=CAM_ASM_000257 /TAXON_ID=200890 /ORGANISM="Paramoeba atlantica, Strain 621/1 / CCAP 1560/9" /LENGTH=153 /DNA_ID=CAMNT_0047857961 /DNA_START=148 /DNA_END=610 /DNA_ORIENTATION=-
MNNEEEEKKDDKLKYEFLDHTADIQIHSWGKDLKESFEFAALAMFDYISEIKTVDIVDTVEISAEGHDLPSLLFGFMDEVLFQFNADYFIAKRIEITKIDTENFKIEAKMYGEPFDLQKHPQGTEIKAMTYSNMQINQKEKEERVDIYVIVDI